MKMPVCPRSPPSSSTGHWYWEQESFWCLLPPGLPLPTAVSPVPKHSSPLPPLLTSTPWKDKVRDVCHYPCGAEGSARGVQKGEGAEPRPFRGWILVFSWRFLSLGDLHSHHCSVLQAGPCNVALCSRGAHFAG